MPERPRTPSKRITKDESNRLRALADDWRVIGENSWDQRVNDLLAGREGKPNTRKLRTPKTPITDEEYERYGFLFNAYCTHEECVDDLLAGRESREPK